MNRQTRRARRREAPEDVAFPVTPMLDMAFQLLAFFVLTFQSPTPETRLDLYLPAAPAALPGGPAGQARIGADPDRSDLDLENDLVIRASADDLGDLRTLTLGESPLDGPEALGVRLRTYARLLDGTPLRVRIVADDRLRYESAARLIAACGAAGVASIRLADPVAPAPGGRP